MNYNFTLLKGICRIVTVSIIYIMAFSIILFLYEETLVMPVYLLGIPIILTGYFLVERYCYHPVVYLLFHIIVYLPVWKISYPVPEFRYLYLVLVTLECFHGFKIWKNDASNSYEEAPWGLYLIMAIMYLIAYIYEKPDIMTLIFVCGILLLLLHFVRLYMEGASKTLMKTQLATSVPTKKMILTSFVLVGFVILAFLLAALFVYVFHIEQYFIYLGKMLLHFLKIIGLFILYVTDFIRALFATNSTIDRVEYDREALTNALNKLVEPSLFARILNGCFILIFFLFLLYELYRFIIYLTKVFLKRYTQDSDIIIPLTPAKNDNIKTVKKRKIPRKGLLQNDNRSKVRRAYKFRIKGYKNDIYHKQDTPTDIANKVYLVYDEDISELTTVYEKARYSNEEITFEDVKKGGIL